MNKKIKKIHSNIGCIFLRKIKLSKNNKRIKRKLKLRGNKKEKENAILKLLVWKVDQLNKKMTKSKLLEISELLENRFKLLWVNLISGIFKGIGIGIGVTIITAVLIIILQKIVSLNIQVIGEFIADIVDIVNTGDVPFRSESERWGHSFLAKSLQLIHMR